MNQKGIPLKRQESFITPDRSRVLLRSFTPGSAERIKAVLNRIMKISDVEAQVVLENVIKEFRSRHHELESVFDRRFNDLKSFLPSRYKPSSAMRRLIGSYFTCEYSLEAAALFNPSIVPHPDQSGVTAGTIRFIMSLRATGEGHISSIEFRTGIIDSQGVATLDAASRFVSSPAPILDPLYNKSEFIAKIQDEQILNAITKGILRALPESFKRSALLKNVARFKRNHKKLSPAQVHSIEGVEALSELNYDLQLSADLPLSERVIFPVSSFESNGIEDARFVRFVDDDRSVTYYSTYTAYNGRAIRPLLLQTMDFSHYRVRSLSGDAAKNKGMAMFPRRIKGKYAMVSRQDAESLYIVFSNEVYRWRKPGKLLQPKYPWELTQIGNCGSPIETEKGWILLTHGVGPVRKYCISAVLLDLDDPSRVIGRLPEPLIAPDESEREGYVPNVVYTCGAIAHNGSLIIPYAMSDYATRIASVSIEDLLAIMK
jgi:predicted GH43/DUF377 family glycosyl hydrolase